MAEALVNLVAKYFTRSFFVSSFLPMVIAAFTLIIFFPFITFRLFEIPLLELASLSLFEILIPLAFVYWLAYLLQNNFNITLKFYKGLYLPRFISRVMILTQYRRVRRQQKYIDEYYRLNSKLDSSSETDAEKARKLARLREFRERAVSEIIRIGGTALIRYENLYPTQLGNIFQAIEYYPGERYGINNSVVWPKLYPLVSDEIKANIKEVIDNLFFFLNSSILFYCIAAFSFIVALFRMILMLLINVDFAENTYRLLFNNILNATAYEGFTRWNTNYSYLALSMILYMLGCLLYRFSLVTSQDYAYSVQSVYDLHRFELLRKMNIQTPKTLAKEKETWKIVSDFLGVGSSFGPINMQYDLQGSESNGGSARVNSDVTAGIRYPDSRSQKASDKKSDAVHVNLGGITLNMGDLLDKAAKVLKKTPASKSRRKKRASAPKSPEKTPKNTRKKKLAARQRSAK